MADSPLSGADGVLRLVLKSNGSAVPETVSAISVQVRRAANTIPSARIVVLDGDMPNGSFPVSDAAWFKPGAAVSVLAGYGDGEDTLFEGLVVKHGLQVGRDNAGRLVVECRDAAVKMTVGRKNANHVDMTDGDLIAKLAGAAGLQADVESTALQHEELVQFHCSDWDFLLSRAEVNGLVVIATDGRLSAKSPAVSAAPVLGVTYGVDLMAFEAEIDARTQFAEVQTVAWDPKTQAALLGTAAAPETLNAQGDLGSASLAAVIGLPTLRLQSGTALPREALDAWAKAQQRKAGLARVRGRMSFQGSAKAAVGSLIELAGVGKHFSGSVYVGALTHTLEDGNWITEVEFGLPPEWFAERRDLAGLGAAGLLPQVDGLQIGVVMKLDGDPAGEHRIQVQVPVLQAATQGVWARLLQFHGSNAFGAWFVPEVGDEVLLGYLNEDPCHPVVLGSLYSSKHPPPYALEAKNDTKAIVTRCRSKIEFLEEDKVITVTTPAGNQVVLSDKEKSITLKDQNGNSLVLDPGGISLDTPKDVKLTAKGTVTIDAVGQISISSKADVKSAGLNVNCEAQVGFVGKGSASAELSAAGQTTVKGAMVMIN